MAKILDTSKPNTLIEHFLGINEFGKPKVWTDEDATYALLIRLILLEPGTYPTKPEMGVGLVSKYRYAKSDSLTDLQNNISNQIETYLPQLGNVDVSLSLTQDKELQIKFTIDSIVYALTYNPETYTLKDVVK